MASKLNREFCPPSQQVMQVSGLPFNSSKYSSVGSQNHWLREGCQELFYLPMDHRLWGHCPCEEVCHHDLEMLVSIKANSSFLQALLHRPPHHIANSTHPPENSSQTYFVFLTGDHAPSLRATVISQGRQLSRQSNSIHLEKKWAIQGHVWSFSFLGGVISGPLKALSWHLWVIRLSITQDNLYPGLELSS